MRDMFETLEKTQKLENDRREKRCDWCLRVDKSKKNQDKN